MSTTTPRHSNKPKAPSSKPRSAEGSASPQPTGSGENGRTLLSRRQLLFGAVGVGAVAAIGIGVATRGGGVFDDGGGDVPVLKVPNSAVTALADFEALESYEDKVEVVNEVDVPYGTLVWMNDDSVAACLLPTSEGSPLTQAALLDLGSDEPRTVLEQATGFNENFEIYDMRATSKGLIWTEANVLKGAWRIYSALDSADVPASATLLEEGDSTYETPTIAAVGDRVFWQVLPKDPNPDKLSSKLMTATMGKNDASCVYESARRMGTPIYAGQDSVTITPRLDRATAYYQLTNINASTGSVTDQMTLPGSMSPLDAGYGDTGFMFSFPDIYNFGDGISNLGTYVPMLNPNGDYDNAKWFGFARTPTAPPCWCNGTLVVKSTRAVCGVDLQNRTYYAIDVDDGADTYGEYLATTGSHSRFVTYTNIDHSPIEGKATHACRIKVWRTLS